MRWKNVRADGAYLKVLTVSVTVSKPSALERCVRNESKRDGLCSISVKVMETSLVVPKEL